MSGHSKWSQIKNKKAVTDAKRSKTFSVMVRLISAAAKTGMDPKNNARLRDIILKAKEINMPKENIDRAIQKSAEEKLEELVMECWAPGGVALIIEAITDSRNRTIAEIKHLLSKFDANLGGPGSVKWMFEIKDGQYQAKNPVTVTPEQQTELEKLFDALDANEDVTEFYSNLEN
ncbi:YebC/PmpR family DNA-binding transcriptional regulator [Candidatus Azambacteria bacterium]|nr:YebC/PmpR family DNA-binding transcriptional regulator [Candidatus Azambacteria bacterium]